MIKAVVFDAGDRLKSPKTALHLGGKGFALAIVLNAIPQARVLGQIHLLAAVPVGCLLFGLPCSLVRGFTNRIAQLRGARRSEIT